MLVTAYEKQSILLQNTRLELQKLQKQNAEMKDELETIKSKSSADSASAIVIGCFPKFTLYTFTPFSIIRYPKH